MKDYLTLRDEWYDKLKESGFEDIEDVYHPNIPLKAWHSLRFISLYEPIEFENQQVYYQMAENFSREHNFSRPFERLVWEAHCEGFSEREIAKELDSYKTGIHKIVSSVSTFMKRGV